MVLPVAGTLHSPLRCYPLAHSPLALLLYRRRLLHQTEAGRPLLPVPSAHQGGQADHAGRQYQRGVLLQEHLVTRNASHSFMPSIGTTATAPYYQSKPLINSLVLQSHLRFR